MKDHAILQAAGRQQCLWNGSAAARQPRVWSGARLGGATARDLACRARSPRGASSLPWAIRAGPGQEPQRLRCGRLGLHVLEQPGCCLAAVLVRARAATETGYPQRQPVPGSTRDHGIRDEPRGRARVCVGHGSTERRVDRQRARKRRGETLGDRALAGKLRDPPVGSRPPVGTLLQRRHRRRRLRVLRLRPGAALLRRSHEHSMPPLRLGGASQASTRRPQPELGQSRSRNRGGRVPPPRPRRLPPGGRAPAR